MPFLCYCVCECVRDTHVQSVPPHFLIHINHHRLVVSVINIVLVPCNNQNYSNFHSHHKVFL